MVTVDTWTLEKKGVCARNRGGAIVIPGHGLDYTVHTTQVGKTRKKRVYHLMIDNSGVEKTPSLADCPSNPRNHVEER